MKLTGLRPKGVTALGFLALCMIVGMLGFYFVQGATRQLLEAEARIDAARWSNYLSVNVKELRSIAEGNPSGANAHESLDHTLTGGYLVSFRIYDAFGYLKLQSKAEPVAHAMGKHISRVDFGFTAALSANKGATLLREVRRKGKPGFLASALVPIKSDNHTVGWLVINLDQTERAELFSDITAKVTAAREASIRAEAPRKASAAASSRSKTPHR